MALSIKNKEVETLAAELAAICGETKTEAIRRALVERKERLLYRAPQRDRAEAWLEFLQREIWSTVPDTLLGKGISKAEREQILGLGDEGV